MNVMKKNENMSHILFESNTNKIYGPNAFGQQSGQGRTLSACLKEHLNFLMAPGNRIFVSVKCK